MEKGTRELVLSQVEADRLYAIIGGEGPDALPPGIVSLRLTSSMPAPATRITAEDVHAGQAPGDDFNALYFSVEALREDRAGVARTYVLASDAPPPRLLGFYTLRMGELDTSASITGPPAEWALRSPTVPVVHMSNFGVQYSAEPGIGARLIADAQARSRYAASHVGAAGVFASAAVDRERCLLQWMGFESLSKPGWTQRMFCPMALLRRAYAQPV